MSKDLPMNYKLGEIDAEIQINSARENKNATISLIKQACYSIDIFSPHLDLEIYNNKEVEQSIFKLAKKHPSTRIRMLVQDSTQAVQSGHCLIRLAQSLTSSVAIHKPSNEYIKAHHNFLIVDKIGLLYHITADSRNYKASVNFKSPQRAGELVDFFNEAWEHSTPDMQTRRIYV
jgi:hypothetical protein